MTSYVYVVYVWIMISDSTDVMLAKDQVVWLQNKGAGKCCLFVLMNFTPWKILNVMFLQIFFLCFFKFQKRYLIEDKICLIKDKGKGLVHTWKCFTTCSGFTCRKQQVYIHIIGSTVCVVTMHQFLYMHTHKCQIMSGLSLFWNPTSEPFQSLGTLSVLNSEEKYISFYDVIWQPNCSREGKWVGTRHCSCRKIHHFTQTHLPQTAICLLKRVSYTNNQWININKVLHVYFIYTYFIYIPRICSNNIIYKLTNAM